MSLLTQLSDLEKKATKTKPAAASKFITGWNVVKPYILVINATFGKLVPSVSSWVGIVLDAIDSAILKGALK